MKFRAVVVGVLEDGRTVQTFCPTRKMAEEWAIQAGQKFKAPVNIFVIVEELVCTVNKPTVERTLPDEAAKPTEAKPK